MQQIIKARLLSLDAFNHCMGFSIGDGWITLVADLTKDLLKIYPDLKVRQVKEKFGYLRYYIDSVPEDLYKEIHAMIGNAESASQFICEICGEAGKTTNITGYYVTLCPKCQKEEVKRREQND